MVASFVDCSNPTTAAKDILNCHFSLAGEVVESGELEAACHGRRTWGEEGSGCPANHTWVVGPSAYRTYHRACPSDSLLNQVEASLREQGIN